MFPNQMEEYTEVRKIIREILESTIEEERIKNSEASQKVNGRENFVGSHVYGEDLGGLGKMYVAYSYGEQHPLYVWYNGQWYHNYEEYRLPDGTPNKWTKRHLETLKPNIKTQGRPTLYLKRLINKFKKKYGLGDNTHTDLEPGEK